MIEDIFSDNLVDTPDDIEQVIEGGEAERQDGSDKGSGDEEGKAENENDKSKEKVKRKFGPRPLLNADRLKGPRGIGIMESFFSDIKLQGKGKEREDLDLVMGRLEHWTHRLFPKMQFDDCLKRIEKLGSQKPVANYVKRIRLGMEEEVSDNLLIEQPDSPPPPEDPFDQLMSDPVPVPTRPVNTDITTEQREQMLRNRLIAEERRASRIKKAQEMKEMFLAKHSQSIQSGGSQSAEVVGEHTIKNQAESNTVLDDSSQERSEGELQIVDDDNSVDRQSEPQESVQSQDSNVLPDIMVESDENERELLEDTNKSQDQIDMDVNEKEDDIVIESTDG